MNALLQNIVDNYSVEEIAQLAQLLSVIKTKKEDELKQSPTLNRFRKEYETYIADNHAPKYLRSVKLSFKHLTEYLVEDPEMKSITPLTVEQFKSHLMKRAPKGYAVYLRNLRAAFSIAVRWGMITDNPFKGMRINKKQNNKKPFLTKTEFQVLIDNTDNEYFIKLFTFAFYTGMRVGEIVNLRWRNVDLVNQIITVGDDDFRTKTGRTREIPISAELDSILEDLYGTGRDEEEYVFQKKGGYKYTEEHVSRKFKDARRKAGLKEGITFHSLRHSFGSNLGLAGVPITTIKELLGHTSIITTQIYSHSNLDSLRSTISKL